MLGRSLPQGSEAISYRNTLFRISELCWIKALRLSIPEMVVKVLALVAGVWWVIAMESAKQTYVNVEFLLAGFPLILAWTTAGSLKIGCSGDFEETYEGRSGLQSSVFRRWIEGIRKREPDWLHLKSKNYDLLLNPHRVAWVRPCWQWKFYPLFVAAVFAGYLAVIRSQVIDFESLPVLDQFVILVFPGGEGTVINLSYLVVFAAASAFLLSIKRSVEICGTGGVQDVFQLSAADQKAVLGILAGSEVKRSAPVKAEVKAPAPKPKPKPAEKKPTPPPVPQESNNKPDVAPVKSEPASSPAKPAEA
jgi:hypothetical protein